MAERFDETRDERWRAGRAERGLGPNDPFAGDWAQEISEEFLDAANYADVGVQRGEISPQERDRIYLISRECWLRIQQVMQDRGQG